MRPDHKSAKGDALTFALVMEGAPLADILAEIERIAEALDRTSTRARLIGGAAVHVHAGSGVHPALARPYRDLDLVTTRKGGRETTTFLSDLGYVPNERFNAMNGHTRLVFYDMTNQRQVDVFVGEFRMCHEIPIADRLEVERYTVPLAELLLTKLQIVKLNEKDLKDIYAIVLEHDVGSTDTEAINGDVVADLLAGDWGLWRTTRGTIDAARGHLASSGLAAAEQSTVDDRLRALWERIEARPKSLRWKSRARIGDRTRWYEEPEEIAHALAGETEFPP
jgi:hypothetical protein